MKNILFLALISTISIWGQTKVHTTDLVGPPSSGGLIFVVLPTGGVSAAILGPGITLDTSTSPPTIKVAAQINDVWVLNKPSSALATITINAAVTTPIEVYRNGLLLNSGDDFTITVNTSTTVITFLSGAIPQGGDTVKAHYRN